MGNSSLFDLGPERLNRLLSLGKEGLEADADPAAEAPAPAPESDSATEQPGSWIGPYRLVRMLGEGGMGAVYLAEQEHPIQRQVALKVIKPGMDTKRVIARFEAERQVLALLDHPYIAHVFNAGRTKAGRPYFVMEYVQGLPITDYCDRQKLTIEERLRLFQHVCEAIHHAHQKGIIHRDIKASNVLVSRQDGHDVPKVIDFGVAKAMGRTLTEHTFSTEDSQLLGTPEYMSPEQADMVREDIDVRSDVYSLGVLLYILLAGVLPFDSDTVRSGGIEQLRRIIREEEPVSPSTRLTKLQEGTSRISENRRTSVVGLRRMLRQELEWIPLKAIRKRREWRYQSVTELGADIDNYLHGKPLLASPPSKLYSARKFIRRHRFAVLAGASIVALALVAIVVLSLSTITISQQKRQTQAALTREEQARNQERQARQEVTEQRDAAYRNLYVAQIRLVPQYWEAGQTVTMKEMLEEYIPEAGQSDLRGWEWYYLLSLCYRDEVTFRGHGSAIRSIAWSPDGIQIASTDTGGTVKIWEVSSARVIATLETHPGVASATWSPDGRLLAVTGDRSITVWEGLATQALVTIPSEHELSGVIWSPDGRNLAASSSDNTIVVMDAMTGKTTVELSRHAAEGGSITWSPDGELIAVGEVPGTARIWEIDTGQQVLAWPAHEHDLWSVDWSPDGSRIATGGYDGTIRIWDPSSGQEVRRIVHAAGVQSCSWNPDGRRICSATRSQRVRIWDAGTGQELQSLRGHDGWVNCVAWSPDGEYVASGGDDRTVRIWNAGQNGRTLVLRHPNCSAMAWSPNAAVLASAGGGELRIWNPVSGEELHRWNMFEDPASIAWDQEGKRLAAGRWGSGGESTTVFDATTGELLQVIPRGTNPAWNPAADRLAVSEGGTVHIWDYSGPNTEVKIGGNVYGLSWSPDGRKLAASAWGLIGVWDDARPEHLVTLLGHQPDKWIGALAWHPDGGKLVSGGWEQKLRVWNLESEREISSLEGHTGAIFSVAWSPDGRRIASGSKDMTVKVWDVETGRELLTLERHHDMVRSAAWSHDGKRLATASPDGAVRIWDASAGYEIVQSAAYTRERIQRYYSKGSEFVRSARIAEAAKLFNKILDLDPNFGPACTQLQRIARRQAVSVAVDERNPKQAIRNANRTARLTQFKEPSCLETLAAAYAEIGDFAEAIQWQQMALDLASRGIPNTRADMRAQLRLYERGQRYREEPLFPTQPTVWLKFDEREGSLANDSSSLGHAGLLKGAPQWRPDEGRLGGAIRLDGRRDYVQLPALDLYTNHLTVSAWIKREGNQGEAGILFCRNDDTIAGFSIFPGNRLGYHWNDHIRTFTWRSGPSIPEDCWVHAVLVVEPDVATVYLNHNGVITSAQNRFTHVREEFNGPICVGLDRLSGGRFFRGMIDDLRLYGYALSEDEVQTIYTAQGTQDAGQMADKGSYPFPMVDFAKPQPPDMSDVGPLPQVDLRWQPTPGAAAYFVYFGEDPDSLSFLKEVHKDGGDQMCKANLPALDERHRYYWRVDAVRPDGSVVKGAVWSFSTGALIGWWKFDETEGDTAIDSSRFGSHGKLAGGPKWQPGRRGGALLFDGQDDEVSVKGAESWSFRDAVTLACWIRTDSFTKAWQPVITRAHNDSWRLIRNASRRSMEFACAGVDVPGTHWGNVLGTSTVDDGQWHHIAGVYDGTQLCLYVDGALDVSSIASGQMNFCTDPVLIGATALDARNRWKGLIDDVRIYSYALCAEEIRALYEGIDFLIEEP